MRRRKRVALGCLSIALLAGVVAASGFTRLPERPAYAWTAALPAGDDSRLDREITRCLEPHPSESGFRLVSDGVDAFALRAESARRATRSLDLQYYIWRKDVTGLLLVRELIAAADRGVRVRLLLDDFDARAKNFALVAIDAHPNIEVRIFNPFATRDGVSGKILEGVLSFSRVNRRMHNKAWIADNRVAIVGGRNIGDEYFTASEEVNFVDLDFAMVGPVVGEVSGAFDDYWNSVAVWPITALNPEKADPEAYAALRASARAQFERAAQSRYVRALATNERLQRLAAHPELFHWSRSWRVLTDDPLKATSGDSPLQRSAVLRGLTAALEHATRSVTLVSAYFVPGQRGTRDLAELARRGIGVSILTNSLAATDVPAVHAGYSKYREPLVASGVALWELKRQRERPEPGLQVFGSSGASLHTKAVIIDRTQVFVGSFNIDSRSVSLNCEQGVLVEHAALASEAAETFEVLKAGANSWRVTHDAAGELQWSDGRSTRSAEPDASLARRMVARVARWLPIEAQL